MSQIKYKRIILRVPGEALAGEEGTGTNPEVIKHLAEEIKSMHDMGVEIGIVYGGRGMWRSETGANLGIERAQADHISMLATIMNGLALQDGLENSGVPAHVQTSIKVRQIAEPYIRRRAMRHLEKGRVAIFGGGAGNPYFSTDITAVLRAAEIDAGVILMAKNGVSGIYSAGPEVDPSAKKYSESTQLDLVSKNLEVMDSAASSLSMDNNTPLVVFSASKPGNIRKVTMGENIGTVIKGDK